MPRWKRILDSTTDLFKHGHVRSAWTEQFPNSTRYISRLNSFFPPMHVSPSIWLSEKRCFSHFGKLYEDAVGLLLGNKHPLLPIERHGYCLELPKWSQTIFRPLEELLLEAELHKVRQGCISVRQRDFFLGLALLADLKNHADGYAPLVPLYKIRPSVTLSKLRQTLRTYYPQDIAFELLSLWAVTKEDLPKGKDLCFKPSFQDSWGGIEVSTTGDLLIDDLLVELKLSLRLFQSQHLWQLFGYIAIHQNTKGYCIRKVGLYNPRYRAFLSWEIEDLIREIGGRSLRSFRKWHRSSLPKLMDGTGIEYMRFGY